FTTPEVRAEVGDKAKATKAWGPRAATLTVSRSNAAMKNPQVKNETAVPKQILYAADKPPIDKRFDHAALDGHITKGEVDEVLNGIAKTPLKHEDLALIKRR